MRTNPSHLCKVPRQRFLKSLREAQDVLTIEIGDDKPEETPCRQGRHCGASVVWFEFWSGRRRAAGDEQRREHAAVAKHHVAEAAALIDTGVPLQHLQCSIDCWRLERRERGVRRTVAAPSVVERDRSLREIEFDGAVLMIASCLARQGSWRS